MKMKSLKGYIIILMSMLIYSFSVPILKSFGNANPPFLNSCLMYLGASISCLLVLIYRVIVKKEALKIEKHNVLWAILVCVTEFIAGACFIVGVSMTTSETSSLLLSFQVICSPFIALAMFKEKNSVLSWIGIALVFGSAIALSFNETGFALNWGALLILLACLLWSFCNNCARKCEGMSSVFVVFLKTTFTFCGMLILSSLSGQYLATDSTSLVNSLIIVLAGFFCYGIAIVLLYSAQNILGVSIAAAFFGMNPCVGAIISLIVFQTVPYFTFYISIGLAFVGLVILIIDQYRIVAKNNRLNNISTSSNEN